MASTTEDKRFTKHGFPKGFRFVPTHLELITILSARIHGRPLNPKVADIFHHVSILDHHPQELYDQYEVDKEDRYIYFFSQRELQKPAGAAAGGPVHRKRQRGAGQDEDDNEPRPVRLAKGGGWKPSGGGHVLRWPKDSGGFVAGKMVAMVFYDHHDEGGNKEQVKSQWGMHEFTIPVDLRLGAKLTKSTRLQDLALYRLYKLNNSDDMESDDGAGRNQALANVSAADGHYLSAPAGAGQPSFGIFNGRNQPLAAGASTSRMSPQQQHHIPNVGHPQYYHHHQYGFGAAPASAAALQRVHTMTTMPLACGAGMLPGRQLFQSARQPGTGLPGRQSFQFARAPPPAPAQMPVPPSAANPASHQDQAPAKATYGGAGQQASHYGATRSLPSARVSTPPLPAAELPSAEELAPMAARHGHGGAGQEAGGSFGGATRSSPAAGSRPAEQDATAMAEPGQHVQFAGCVKPEEEVPPPIPADNYDSGIGMVQDLHLDLGTMFEERFLFSMDELCCPTTFDEAPLTKGGNN